MGRTYFIIVIITIHMNYNHLPVVALIASVSGFQVLCLSDYLFQLSSTETTILHGSDNSTTLRSAL